LKVHRPETIHLRLWLAHAVGLRNVAP
jgi:hypothetical protein